MWLQTLPSEQSCQTWRRAQLHQDLRRGRSLLADSVLCLLETLSLLAAGAQLRELPINQCRNGINFWERKSLQGMLGSLWVTSVLPTEGLQWAYHSRFLFAREVVHISGLDGVTSKVHDNHVVHARVSGWTRRISSPTSVIS